MANKLYLKKINNGEQTLWIKDQESQEEIANIKGIIKSAMRWLGQSSTEIEEGDRIKGYVGPFTIDGIVYAPEYLYISANPSDEHAPTFRYKLNQNLEEIINGVTYYIWKKDMEDSYFPDVLYTSTYNVGTSADITFYYKNNGNLEPYEPTSPATAIYHSPAQYNATHPGEPEQHSLIPGYVTAYEDIEYVWGGNGWEAFGKYGNLSTKRLAVTTIHDTPSLSGGTLPAMTYDQNDEILTFTPGSFPTIEAGSEVTVATGETGTTGSGAYVITPAS